MVRSQAGVGDEYVETSVAIDDLVDRPWNGGDVVHVQCMGRGGATGGDDFRRCSFGVGVHAGGDGDRRSRRSQCVDETAANSPARARHQGDATY